MTDWKPDKAALRPAIGHLLGWGDGPYTKKQIQAIDRIIRKAKKNYQARLKEIESGQPPEGD